MRKLLSAYCIAYLALLIIVSGMLYAYPKIELHLMLNSAHTPIQDLFFQYYTVMAEWPLYVVALLPLFWKETRATLFFAVSEVSAGAVSQLLKHTISADRPICLFENYPDLLLPLVEGVDLHTSNSFPSGHASTFFVFTTCCAILLAYRYRQRAVRWSVGRLLLFHLLLLSLLLMAALGAYSRVYLSQHFLSDVYAGSIIGFATPFLVFRFAGEKILNFKTNKTTYHEGIIAQDKKDA